MRPSLLAFAVGVIFALGWSSAAGECSGRATRGGRGIQPLARRTVTNKPRAHSVCAVVALCRCCCAVCVVSDARPVALSSSTRLTHAPSYVAPPKPDDVAAFVVQQQSSSSLDSGADALTSLAHCSDCQLFMQVAEWAAASNTTMSLLEVLADGLCSKYAPTSATCPKLVADIIAFGEKVPALLKHVGLYEPIRACSFLGICSVSCCDDATSPQQISLSIGSSCTEMHVSWVTGGNATESVVQYGLQGQLNNRASGYSLSYTQGGWLGTIHRVVLTGLQPGSVYSYSVGGVGATSAQFTFSTWDDSNVATPFRIAVVGDMAAGESDYATKNIAYLNEQEGLQAVIHIGDVSYADGQFGTHSGGYEPSIDASQPLTALRRCVLVVVLCDQATWRRGMHSSSRCSLR